MEKTKLIFKKEFKSYFISPIAYIVMSIFLLIVGWLFFSTFFLSKEASLTRFFMVLPIAFAFIIPAVTMRLFSEELNVGTYELLMTLPVKFTDIIMGKFLAGVSFICVMLAPTLLYAICTSFLGTLDWGPVIGGYIGSILLAASFCAIGILASTCTRNQVIAFIIGMTICVSLTIFISERMIYLIPNSMVGFFQYLSADYHFQNIAKGLVDSRDVLYFVTICFLALYGANLIMQEKK